MIDSSLFFKGIPYVAVFYITDKVAYLYRTAEGANVSDKITKMNIGNLFGFPIISLNLMDMLWGIIGCGCLFLYIWYKDST